MNRLLGVDYGERRIGFAASDPSGTMALPLRVVEVRSEAQAIKAVCDACAESGAGGVVVGLPVNMNGTEGPMAERVRAFAAKLAAKLGLPVETWDERLSTGMVERVLLDADMSRRRRRQVRDKLAAQVILQGYLDARVARNEAAAGESRGGDERQRFAGTDGFCSPRK